MSAYALFFRDQCDQLRLQNVSITFREVCCRVNKIWNQLSSSEKNVSHLVYVCILTEMYEKDIKAVIIKNI